MAKVKNKLSYEYAETITPIDGRYREKVEELAPFFSEYGLQRYRIFVELEFLKKLSAKGIIPKLNKKDVQSIKRLFTSFDLKEFKAVKEIELNINHDVKAVEYYLRQKFQSTQLKKYIPYLHIGLTSEDTTNLAYSLILDGTRKKVLAPLLKQLLSELRELAESTKHVPFLARTHGQPAVPTTFGKEMTNYYFRLKKQLQRIEKFEFEGKCTGAVGSFNALQFAYPQVNWISFSNDFVRSLALEPNLGTTQILPYDNWIEFFQTLILINGILVDASVNFWLYIMLETLIQKKGRDEIGSSTMPQKVNPINFENAEGSLQLANNQFEFYGRKLIESRLQRDLSDSTVRRTFGIAFAYSVLGWKSMMAGLKKITVNTEEIKAELDRHWEVLAEAVQTYLRSTGDEKAYEKLKDLTQGKRITKELYFEMLQKLRLDKEKKFTELTPEKYVGLAEKLVELII